MSRFCRVLERGLKDEASADRYYARLSKALMEEPGDAERRRDLDIIDRVRRDEQGHKVALTALHNRRCT